MIDDLDETIRELLKTELASMNGDFDVNFEQPRRENTAKWSARPTVNFYLYDLRENNLLRRHKWNAAPKGNGSPADHIAHLKRSPFRVDCLYMLTTWARRPEDEHRLLTRCLLALFRYPVLPVDRLVGSLREPPYDIQARLASHDKLTNPAEVWSALDNEIKPSVSYVVTLALDPWEETRDEPIVRTVTQRWGQAKDLPGLQRLLTGTEHEKNTIGGTVRDPQGAPLTGVQVSLDQNDWVAETDEQGRFKLGPVPSRGYKLIAQPVKGEPVPKEIVVPAVDADGEPVADGDYDLVVRG